MEGVKLYKSYIQQSEEDFAAMDKTIEQQQRELSKYNNYNSGTSDKGPSKKKTTSLQSNVPKV